MLGKEKKVVKTHFEQINIWNGNHQKPLMILGCIVRRKQIDQSYPLY